MVKGGTVKSVVCFVIEVRAGLPSRRGPWVLPWELQRHTDQSTLSSSFLSLPWASLPSPPGTYQPQRPGSYNSNSTLTAIKWCLCHNQPALLPFPWEPTTIPSILVDALATAPWRHIHLLLELRLNGIFLLALSSLYGFPEIPVQRHFGFQSKVIFTLQNPNFKISSSKVLVFWNKVITFVLSS